ncbi:hypothetical protein ACFCX4_11110 [Kitasatospora sp. NPDC056327]|uniref:hypothetical protein n=1 Tax=Kitasatospora sp. NPDC056327 TaxID=3345785 RepID=UPI0035E27695
MTFFTKWTSFMTAPPSVRGKEDEQPFGERSAAAVLRGIRRNSPPGSAGFPDPISGAARSEYRAENTVK